jgi:hypothetical protein
LATLACPEPSSRRRRHCAALSLSLLAAAGVALPAAAASAGGGRTLEGYPAALQGTTTPSPVQVLVDTAKPGDHIKLHAGTYTGQITISHSGTAGAPITIEPYGDGPVTLTADFPAEPCGNTKPAMNRTIFAAGGVDYWTIQKLKIVNGIWISGSNFDTVAAWFHGLADAHDWQTRRSLPGRGTQDPVAAKGIYSALSNKLGVNVDPAEGWRILGNDMSGRGVHGTVTRGGEIGNNKIHNIACGIGPGVWLVTYSDFWKVHHNRINSIAASTWKHYMQEGIRVGGASNYNRVEYNTVSDLPGDGRGINTDIDASYNTFQRNTVMRAEIGFNDQQSGWQNTWAYNTADAIRGSGFNFRNKDATLSAPSMDTSTYKSLVQCNRVTNSPLAMTAGALNASTFTNNYFSKISLSSNLQRYWTQYNNTWNGSSAVPPPSPPQPPAGAC